VPAPARALAPAGGPGGGAALVGVAVTALLRAPGFGYAVLIRRATAPAAGAWSLPGGRPRWGEPLAAAALRELHEETGLGPPAAALLGGRDAMFAATDAIYASHHYVVTHALALVAAAGGAGGGGPPSLPALAAGDDAADAVWVADDAVVPPGAPLLAAPRGTRVLRLSELPGETVPLTGWVLSRARDAAARLAR